MSRLFSKEATPIRDRKIAETQRRVDEPDSPPIFTFLLRPRFVQEGQSVKLLACLNAKPTPKITWLKDGKALPVTLRLCENYYYGVATIEIVGVEKDDEGVYTCVAENELGTAKTECLLSVEAKSYIPAKPQSLLILESKLLDRTISSNYDNYYSSQSYSSFTNSAVTALSRQTSRVAPPQPTPQAERAAVGLPPSGRAARQAISTNLMKTSSTSATASTLLQRSSSTRARKHSESDIKADKGLKPRARAGSTSRLDSSLLPPSKPQLTNSYAGRRLHTSQGDLYNATSSSSHNSTLVKKSSFRR